MVKYYMPYLNENSIYSCDMVRIGFKLRYGLDVAQVAAWLSDFSCASCIYSPRSYQYRYCITYNLIGCSFTVLLSFYGDQTEQLKGAIEFNPNKVLGDVYYCDGFVKCGLNEVPFDGLEMTVHDVYAHNTDVFDRVMVKLKTWCKSWEVVRFDFAADLMVMRTEVQLIKDKRKYSQFRKSQADLTEYLGCRSQGGRVKIYNKTIESELDYDCTRIEITCDSFSYDDFFKRFPELYLHRHISDTDDVLVQLLSRLPVDEFDFYYSRLGRRKRDVVRELVLCERFTVPGHVFEAVVDVVKNFEF